MIRIESLKDRKDLVLKITMQSRDVLDFCADIATAINLVYRTLEHCDSDGAETFKKTIIDDVVYLAFLSEEEIDAEIQKAEEQARKRKKEQDEEFEELLKSAEAFLKEIKKIKEKNKNAKEED